MHNHHIGSFDTTSFVTQSMEQTNRIYEMLGIAKFMIFLSTRLTEREYQRVCDLQTEYLDDQLDRHLLLSSIVPP